MLLSIGLECLPLLIVLGAMVVSACNPRMPK